MVLFEVFGLLVLLCVFVFGMLWQRHKDRVWIAERTMTVVRGTFDWWDFSMKVRGVYGARVESIFTYDTLNMAKVREVFWKYSKWENVLKVPTVSEFFS